ncbi:MAG: hypothetical protein ABIP48_02320 [Planctomycetota bacterium]
MFFATTWRRASILVLAGGICLLPAFPGVGQEADFPTALRLARADEPTPAQPPNAQPAAPTPQPQTDPADVEAQPPARPKADEPIEPAAPPARPPAERFRRTSPPRSPILRLASVPNMLGDFFNQGGQLRATGNAVAVADLPIAGGGRRLKIAENNKALPMNRCYFMYHHFQNALDADPNLNVPGGGRAFSVDRYTVGVEKTFLCDRWSVDVRMPFSGEYGVTTGNFAVQGGEIGNLAITLKRLLVANECGAVAAGLGVDVPTGSDVSGRFGQVDFTLHNNAVHLSPYVGFLSVPSPRLFCLGFAQLDVAANGNRVDYFDNQQREPGQFGRLTEQTLLYLDVSTGYWLYRNPCACGLTGLASLVEFHYTTALDDADLVNSTVSGTGFQFGNRLNRIDVVDLTVGLHAEICRNTTVRVAGAFPLNDTPEKPFDAEIHVSVNRRF